MTVFATFDAAGLPTGFWPDLYFPAAADGTPDPRVPAGAVAITDDQWQDLSAHHGLRRMVGGEVVDYTPPAAPPPPRQQLGGTFLGAVADLGWWGWMEQGAAAQVAAGKPLDGRYWQAIGKADTVLATDAKLNRVAAAAERARVAASGQPAPAAPVITMAAAMDHGDAMVAPAPPPG